MSKESSKDKKKDSSTELHGHDIETNDSYDDVTHIGASAMTPDHTPRPWFPLGQQSNRNKKLFVIGVVVAIFVALVGGWFTYALWQQSPDEILTDAITNAVSSDTATFEGSTLHIAGDQSMRVAFSGKFGHKEGVSAQAKMALETNGIKIDIDADGVHMPNTDNYVRIKDAEKLYGSFDDVLAGGSDVRSRGYSIVKEFLDTAVKSTVEKVDNKWIAFSVNDVKTINAQLAEQYGCTQNTLKKIREDTGQLIEVGAVYRNNTFLKVKKNLGDFGNYFRFEVGVENDKLSDFEESLKGTKFYKELQACWPTSNNPIDFDFLRSKDAHSVKGEVWIDQSSREFHTLNFETVTEKNGAKGTMKFALTTAFNQPVEIKAPKEDVITFDEAFADITKYLNGFLKLGVNAIN